MEISTKSLSVVFARMKKKETEQAKLQKKRGTLTSILFKRNKRKGTAMLLTSYKYDFNLHRHSVSINYVSLKSFLSETLNGRY
jgi:hypothetical protein